MTSLTVPLHERRKSCASRTSSRVIGAATAFFSSRFTTATLFSPQTLQARRTTSAFGSAVIPRTAHDLRRAPQHGHSISRMFSRMVPIQSTL